MSKLVVLLDNGHGKETPGKRSPKWEETDQIFEWEYTRRLVKEIDKRLKNLSINSFIITPEEEDIPLWVRTLRVRQYEKKYGHSNCFTISIHLNAWDYSSDANGWEAHTYLGYSKSDEYSKLFYREAEKLLKDKMRIRYGGPIEDPDYDSNFAIIRDVKGPAILTENGFMTNLKDSIFLNSEEGFNTIVDIHVNTIKKISETL